MPSAFPILLLGGAAAFILGSKKKKRLMPQIDHWATMPEYLQNEKVELDVWGSVRTPGELTRKVGQNSFTHLENRPKGEPGGTYYSASQIGSSDSSVVSIERDQGMPDTPIIIFRPLKPGKATLSVQRDDDSIFILNVTVVE